MSNKGSSFHSVTYENIWSPDPVTADEINVQSVMKIHNKTSSKSERDDSPHFFDGIILTGKSPYYEDGVLKQGVSCNGACKSSAPFIEEILADEQLGIHHTIRVDPYLPQPAYNPWYKPFAKRVHKQSTTDDELPDFITTYQIRPHNSWSHGQCLGTIIAIVIFVALFVYIIMGLGGHFKGSRWNPWLE